MHSFLSRTQQLSISPLRESVKHKKIRARGRRDGQPGQWESTQSARVRGQQQQQPTRPHAAGIPLIFPPSSYIMTLYKQIYAAQFQNFTCFILYLHSKAFPYGEYYIKQRKGVQRFDSFKGDLSHHKIKSGNWSIKALTGNGCSHINNSIPCEKWRQNLYMNFEHYHNIIKLAIMSILYQ